jgi:hypothetical protein
MGHIRAKALPVPGLFAKDAGCMFELIKQFFRGKEPPPRETWEQTFRRLGRELVPLAGEAETLQGELVRCIANLRGEAQRNGWMNWDVQHVEAVETLRRFLPEPEVFSEGDRQAIHQALDRVLYAGKQGADHGEMAYAELDFLVQRVVEWCERSDGLFYKRPECIWLDDDPLAESS